MMEGNKVFKYNGVEMDLDVADMTVDDRIEKALADMLARGAAIDKDKAGGGGMIRKTVDMIADCLNQVFDRPDAAKMIFGEETNGIAIVQRFADAVTEIGRMRSAAFAQMAQPLVAVSAARLAAAPDKSVKANWPGAKPTGAPVPKNPRRGK